MENEGIMNRVKWLKVIIAILFLAVIWQGVTDLGHLLSGYKFIEHGMFIRIHTIGGISLLILAAIHLTLNWSWIRHKYFGKHSKGGGTP